jgi:hypothetical protein
LAFSLAISNLLFEFHRSAVAFPDFSIVNGHTIDWRVEWGIVICFRSNIIPILANILSDSVKEKVTRIILAVFRVSVCGVLTMWLEFLSHVTMLWHMWTIHLHFSGHCIMYSFSSVLIAFHWIFNWIALDDVDLWLTHFVNKSQCLYHPCDYITIVINPYTWLMAWQWHYFLLASNTRAARDCEWQMALNQKLLCEFEKCWKFSGSIKAKSLKMRRACIMYTKALFYILVMFLKSGHKPETHKWKW